MSKIQFNRFGVAFAALALPLAALAQNASDNAPGRVEVLRATHHDTGFVLKDAPPKAQSTVLKEAKDKRRVPYVDQPGHLEDLATQSQHINGPRAATSSAVGGSAAGGVNVGMGVDGIGNGVYGFSPNSAPPDTTGAVGSTQFVQWVNTSFAVFDKATGAKTYGPAAGNTLFSGFGGVCESSNDGDPIVQYDKAAKRWVLMQFAVPSGGPYTQCVAISDTDNALGTYKRWAFTYTGFNDYPKVGVWPDGYYVAYNIFNGNSFGGSKVCAFDRAAMLAGNAGATQQCFQLSTSYGGLLPSDLDGPAPAAGTPNFFMNLGSGKLNLWKFSVNWANPGASTFTGPTALTVSSFAAACGGGTCIPQAGTSNQLDSLADRLMYRLAYRKLSTGQESLVVNHSVKAGGTNTKNTWNGVRWYEVRSPSTTPVVYQTGTYAPDTTTSRWMGSIAMDKAGNIALGYSVSGSSMKPAIRYATRLATDAVNTLSNETTVIQGGGSQFGSYRLTRWGDYSHMSVDPVDDCTFWFTTEYLKADGVFNWNTRIAAFKIAGCS